MYIEKIAQIEISEHWTITELVIAFQLIFILFERIFIQWGAPNFIIYINDICITYLLARLLIDRKKTRFSIIKIIYIFMTGLSLFIGIIYNIEYCNNFLFSLFELRNILRFLMFFLAVVTYLSIERIEEILKIIEIHFYLNSLFIIYMYFTYFPDNAMWMRGDLLNGFFGNTRGGNTFVNVEMLVVVLHSFVKWTKEKESLLKLIILLGCSVLIAGLIELKAFIIEIALCYIYYLFFVDKTKREKRLNVIICSFGIIVAYIAIRIMLIEYPWFEDVFTVNGIIEMITSENYSSVDDLNRFTGIFTIASKMFENNLLTILFGIGLGNGATTELEGTTTVFASNYGHTNYSWFLGLYMFVQCGLIGLLMYLSTFFCLLKSRKNNYYKSFSNMMALLAIFLVFYGEALKTDAGYLIYFSIAAGFVMNKAEEQKCRGLKEFEIIDNNTSIQC